MFSGLLPVDDGELLGQRRPVRLADGHLDAVAQQRVDLLVGTGVVHDGARLGDLGDRLLDRLGRHSRVEALDRLPEAPGQEDLRLVVATERAIGPERLVVGVDVLPAKLLEQLDRGLLDELVLGRRLQVRAARLESDSEPAASGRFRIPARQAGRSPSND